jgi:spoIIIJ-associated protein
MKRTTLEVIAPSVEEAIARAVDQLGVPREQFDVEILDAGSKGFLGIGGRQVRLRLTVKDTNDVPPINSSDVLPTSTGAIPPITEPTRRVSPGSSTGKVDSEPAGASRREAGKQIDDALLSFSIQTTSDLLAKMKIKAHVSAKYGVRETEVNGDVPVLIDINGDDLSVLIGRRAETLNALQYILALIISKEASFWVQVIVDVEGYRARRERQLRQLARRMAEQTIRTGKRQLLEPMSAAERRIVHLELRGHETVTTESIGEDPNRKVCLILKK